MTEADGPTAPAEGPDERSDPAASGSDTGSEPAASEPERRPTRRLSLDEPLPGRAAEDRPESWGEQAETDADRLRFYRGERPPHHGD